MKREGLKKVEGLTAGSRKTYRYLLRKHWKRENDPTLSKADRDRAQKQRLQIEWQLGIKAQDVPGPGRPREF